MNAYCIVLLIAIKLVHVINSKDDFIPVMVWTSPRIYDGPNLASSKISCDLFDYYITRKLCNRKPLIIIFTEQSLNVNDFQRRNDECGPFPFLSNITERVDFFPQVENPHEAFKKLTDLGYNWEHARPELKVRENDSAIFLMEFPKINPNNREVTLRNHNDIMARVTENLKGINKDWICIYTARHKKSKQSKTLEQLTCCDTDPKSCVNRPWELLYLYKDIHQGLALLTRGPIHLHLPTPKEYTSLVLENHHAVTFHQIDDCMDFVVWFLDYTITFYMSLTGEKWQIESINIQNRNGNTIKLWPTVRNIYSAEKCYIPCQEFHSKGKPLAKVEIKKYKVVQLHDKIEDCIKVYTIPFLFFFMCVSIIGISFAWNIIISTFKIPIDVISA